MNTQPPPKTVWPCVNYDDAHAAITFLVAVFGFKETAYFKATTPGAERAPDVNFDFRNPAPATTP